MTETGRVHIVDDDERIRDSLGMLLRSVGLETDAYASGEEFLERYRDEGPACLLLDLRMPGMSGLEVQEELGRRDVGPQIIFFTGHGEVTSAVRSLHNGAFDFIEKPFNHDLLVERVRKAILCDGRDREQRAERARIMALVGSLTPRELEVLRLVAQGKATKEIAAALRISHRTVDSHRARILEKTGAHTVAEVIRIGLAYEELLNG